MRVFYKKNCDVKINDYFWELKLMTETYSETIKTNIIVYYLFY